MTRFQWILVALVLATWIPAYVWFFHKDVLHWWHTRRDRRAREQRERAERLAVEARLREELAAKYLSGGSGPGPRA